MAVLISGAGIAGLTLGLTLHEASIPFHIFERVGAMKPLGVGINLQPTAVRELLDMELGGVLERVGVPTQDYGFYSKTGVEIWTEPRGLLAGYKWPQYSVHRGELQMELYRTLIERAGADCISTGQGVRAYESTSDGVVVTLESGARVEGQVLVGADGIHSAVRAQMYPDEGAPIWAGAIMWRGTSRARPFLSGASMVLAGNDTQRIVAYPISSPDPDTGVATINWIAEKTVDPESHVSKEDWNREVDTARFLEDFRDWDFEWLNVPALIEAAERVYEYPMVDRDPVGSWVDGSACLIGDAAHATYPVGSNGASQAILDARILVARFLEHGVNRLALDAYDADLRPGINKVLLANRGSGPDAIMQMAEDRCGGDFTRLDEVLPVKERRVHADHYKALAGLSVDVINARAPLISKGARNG